MGGKEERFKDRSERVFLNLYPLPYSLVYGWVAIDLSINNLNVLTGFRTRFDFC